MDGVVNLVGTVSATGQVRNCHAVSETPRDMGFGDAAAKLCPYFLMSPQTSDGQAVDGASVNIAIKFNVAR